MVDCFHVVSMDAFFHKCINRVSELRRLWNILHAYVTYLCLYENYIHGFDLIMNLAIWLLSSRNYINRCAMITTQREIKKYNFVSISLLMGLFIFDPRVSTRGTASIL